MKITSAGLIWMDRFSFSFSDFLNYLRIMEPQFPSSSEWSKLLHIQFLPGTIMLLLSSILMQVFCLEIHALSWYQRHCLSDSIIISLTRSCTVWTLFPLSPAVAADEDSGDDNEEDEDGGGCCYYCMSEAQWFILSGMCWTWSSSCFSVERKDPEGSKINKDEDGGRGVLSSVKFYFNTLGPYCKKLISRHLRKPNRHVWAALGNSGEEKEWGKQTWVEKAKQGLTGPPGMFS